MGESARQLQCDYLVNADGEFAEPVDWGNLKHLGLVEARAAEGFDIRSVVYYVMNTEQAPYLEFYLSPSSNALLWHPAAKRGSRDELPKEFRVCFFLHLLHPHLGSVFSPPTIKYGERAIRVMRITRVPDHLRSFAWYVPVD
jgi:hypothetical protein